MRSGKLLAQSNPDDLITAFNVLVSLYICVHSFSAHLCGRYIGHSKGISHPKNKKLSLGELLQYRMTLIL